MMTNISAHPNPQFERQEIQMLNGAWDFGFKKRSGKYVFEEDKNNLLNYKNKTDLTINVPFCIESELSGIGYTDFVSVVWYKRNVNINKNNGRVFLNIGAADYETSVFVNDSFVGSHKGGFTSFKFDITDYAIDGKNELYIVCEDDTKSPFIAGGKQSDKKHSYGCSYTRTTGIWQSVYLEYVPNDYVKSFKIYPDDNRCLATVMLNLVGKNNLKLVAKYDGKVVGEVSVNNACGATSVELPLSEKHLWEVGCGRLYDLEITFGDDNVLSYFGLRTVRLDDMKFLLNGKSVFQRLVLDQGFYKKGIYTAQNDDELVKDIELSLSVGFNGARLHQKVFDPRFLYFCDKMGYIVWSEYGNWGIDYSNPRSVDIFLKEWAESIDRDFNHPAIIGWCPFNETWNYKGRRKQYDPLLRTVYEYTKAVDITRPCIDTSGNFHVVTDIYDVHDYRYKPDEFKRDYDRLVTEGYLYEHVLNDNPGRQKYNGEPVFISEYGGIKWEADKEYKSWGYGVDVKTEQELADRYCGLTKAILDNEKILGFCYTQLYDVEQEQNGLFTYERKPKFADEIYAQIKACNESPAKIEE